MYVEGVKRGNLIVAVRAPEERLAAAEDIFRAGKALDIDARRQEWEEAIVPLNAMASADVEYPATQQ